MHVRTGDQELVDQLSFLHRAVAGYHVNFFAVRLRSYDVDEELNEFCSGTPQGRFPNIEDSSVPWTLHRYH